MRVTKSWITKGSLRHRGDNFMMHKIVDSPYYKLLDKHLHEHRAVPHSRERMLARGLLGRYNEEKERMIKLYPKESDSRFKHGIGLVTGALL